MTLSLIILLISVLTIISTRQYMRTHPREDETQFTVTVMVLGYLLGWIGIPLAFGMALA